MIRFGIFDVPRDSGLQWGVGGSAIRQTPLKWTRQTPLKWTRRWGSSVSGRRMGGEKEKKTDRFWGRPLLGPMVSALWKPGQAEEGMALGAFRGMAGVRREMGREGGWGGGRLWFLRRGNGVRV